MLTRRQFSIASGAGALAQAALPRAAGAEPRPALSGPVSGGRRGAIFGAYYGDIGRWDYVEEEYFLGGVAQNYLPAGPLPQDGRWQVRPGSTAPFLTRFIIRRPRDPARFNGTVVCEWANVSSGYEIAFAEAEGYYRSGFAYAAVSAQPVGLEGFPGQQNGLRAWDPERYGKLHVPGDSYSFDIFTQVGRALGPQRPRGGRDPMGGLDVRRLIAIGGSQSATRLTAYANAVQPIARVFSAILLVVGGGYGADLADFVFDPARTEQENTARRRAAVHVTRIRTDQPTPVMYVNSEQETLRYAPRRQADSDTFRYWEVAGSTHGTAPGLERINLVRRRDGIGRGGGADPRLSDVDWLPTVDAAVHHVQRWITGGPPPPVQPPIVLGADMRSTQVDTHGNSLGGVRLPEVEVPVARYEAMNLRESRQPFSPEKLKALYPTPDIYVARMTAAAQAAEAAGVILPYRTAEYVAKARETARAMA